MSVLRRGDGKCQLVGLLVSKCLEQPLSIRDFWQATAHRERLVEEFSSSKLSTRLAHLSKAIHFLRNHNVLVHGSLHASASCWNVTSEFSRVAAFGESVLRNELCLRVLKHFPSINDDAMSELVDHCCSTEWVASLYDLLQLNGLLDKRLRRQLKPTQLQKQSLVLAMLGEMHWFAVRTKATDRTHNNALFPPSDVLILHSLCAHSVESIVVELFASCFELPLRELKSMWKNFHCSLPSQLQSKPRTLFCHALSTRPNQFTAGSAIKSNVTVAVSPVPVLGSFNTSIPFPSKVKNAGFRGAFHHYKHHKAALEMSQSPVARNTTSEVGVSLERQAELLRMHVC
ncbi:RNA editing complex protein MP44, putative [Bodo saltans]|uniref:RNA editing complex protein MP44, putative n=1 Tax=Bodo saltans TaxID=75058 RepID=A0A0S4JVK9_BODSA|nr:RNA editing complex protein MP44, putative [Bodo saltans]|eukprot:CUG94080.1 RNA editing complex protein MP44, putative [Bodo saltans]